MLQLVLPDCLQGEVFQQLHTYHGHQGAERTTELILQRCYWPALGMMIKDLCQRCSRCSVAKNIQPQVWETKGHLLLSRLNGILALDFSLLEPAQVGREYALVMTLVFSKFIQVIPTRDQQASTQRSWSRNGSISLESHFGHTLTRIEVLRNSFPLLPN